MVSQRLIESFRPESWDLENQHTEGTFAAGFTRDYYESWKVMCLGAPDVEDDIFIFGFYDSRVFC